MPVKLPTTAISRRRIDPKILILYGSKKVGKTKLLTELPNCLIVDGEEGTHIYDNVYSVDVSSVSDIVDLKKQIQDAGVARAKEKKTGLDLFPYRYIALDTLDAMEDFCERAATAKYKQSTIGKNFTGSSVLSLDHGLGYGLLREEVIAVVKAMASVCPHLIVISHMKEKITNKGGNEVSSQDISLTGKLGQMVAAMADAIGYLYRKPKSGSDTDAMMVSFRNVGEGVTMGARQKHLAGQTFEFDWRRIYITDPALHPGGLPAVE